MTPTSSSKKCPRLSAISSIARSTFFFFFFQAEDGIRDLTVTGVQTCALPILKRAQRKQSLLLRRAIHEKFPDNNNGCFPSLEWWSIRENSSHFTSLANWNFLQINALSGSFIPAVVKVCAKVVEKGE